MGEVWQAHDEPADRLVALKFIKTHLLSNPSMRTRFTNEAKTLGKLDHDRIVPLYTVVEEGEHLAFVLRFIEGQSLADRIASQFPLPASFVLSSARDILSALGSAHQKGIIHRDMKPQNILVNRQDLSFLTDFGIAVTESLERATVGTFAIGTPDYMSPEQIARPRDLTIANGGHRTDIYSYGVVLFEMLTGNLPFGKATGHDGMYAILQAHCQVEPPSLRALQGTVTPAMEAVVLHCLQKDPDHRPQTCAALLAEIEEAANGLATEDPAAHQPRQYSAPRTPTIFDTPSAPPANHAANRVTAVAPSAPAALNVDVPVRKSNTLMIVGALAILLAVGGAGAWWFMRNNTSKQPDPVETSKPPVTTPAPIAKPDKGPPPSKPTVVQVPTPNPVHPTVPGPTPEDPSAEAKKRAATLAARAQQEFDDLNRCGALSTLQEAIKIYPDPEYKQRLKSYETGCNMQSQ